VNTPNITEQELPPDSIQVIEHELQQIRGNHIAALLTMQAKLSDQISPADTDAKRITLRNMFDAVGIEIAENIERNQSSNAAVSAAQLITKL
jgi:hypothetical protein